MLSKFSQFINPIRNKTTDSPNLVQNKSFGSKISNGVKHYQSDIILGLVIVMITVISFNLGRLSERGNPVNPIVLKDGLDIILADGQPVDTANKVESQTASIRRPQDPTVYASKKSKTHYYHFSWCSGAKQISPENKLTFANESEAISAGYRLASNCNK